MKENPVRQTVAMKARIHRLRVRYRRWITLAGVICFILGCVAGALAFRWYDRSNPDVNAAAVVEVTPQPQPVETPEPEAESENADVFPEDGDEGDPVAEQDAFPEVEKGGQAEGEAIFPEDDEEEPTPEPTPEPTAVPTTEPTPVPDMKSDEVPEHDPEQDEVPEEYASLPDENGEVEAPEGKPAEAETTEAQPAEAETSEAETAEAQPAEAETSETETVEAEPAEAETTATEPAAPETAEAQPAEAGTVEAEPAEAGTAATEVTEAQPAEAETAEAEPAETPVPAALNEPQVVAIVPYGESFTYTTQINADGSARVDAGSQPYETVCFTQRMVSYMRPTDFAAKYSTQYKLQGDEAGAGFELVLNDYTGEATIVPQNVIDVSLRSESGTTVERGYQLMDAEIAGNYGIALNTNTPKVLYKRYQYSSDREEMFYLVVTTYNDGNARMILFELESDEPEPTPEIVYGILQKGIKGDAVLEMQQRLIELGYLKGEADGAFGTMTEDAIKAAQEAFGMEVNGIADNAFQQKLYEGMVRATPEPGSYTDLKVGSSGDAVIRLQARLRELGHYEGKADGGYGELTESAVKQAQKALGLEATGIADADFQQKLFAEEAAPSATPAPAEGDSVD